MGWGRQSGWQAGRTPGCALTHTSAPRPLPTPPRPPPLSPSKELSLLYNMDAVARAAAAAAGEPGAAAVPGYGPAPGADGRVVSVLDMRGVGLANLDGDLSKLVVRVAQAAYPERWGREGGWVGKRAGGAGRRPARPTSPAPSTSLHPPPLAHQPSPNPGPRGSPCSPTPNPNLCPVKP